MKISFYLVIFLFAAAPILKAEDLDNVKNPFEDGLPEPAPVVVSTPQEAPKPAVVAFHPIIHIPKPVIQLPAMKLQGVIVGEDVHQAIIDDQVVPLGGHIRGALVESISKEGVGLLFKGKKFFLKVD